MKPLKLGDFVEVDIGSTGCSLVGSAFESLQSVLFTGEERGDELSSSDHSHERVVVGSFPKFRSVSEAILARKHMDESRSLRQGSSKLSMDEPRDEALTSQSPSGRTDGNKLGLDTSRPRAKVEETRESPVVGTHHAVKGEDSSKGMKAQSSTGPIKTNTGTTSSQNSPTIPISTGLTSVSKMDKEQPNVQILPAGEPGGSTKDEDSSKDRPTGSDISSTLTSSLSPPPSTKTSDENNTIRSNNKGPSASASCSPQKPLPDTSIATPYQREVTIGHNDGLRENDSVTDLKTNVAQTASSSSQSAARITPKDKNDDPTSLTHSENPTRDGLPTGRDSSAKIAIPTQSAVAWTMTQHRDFVSAVFTLGLTHCSPSLIMEEMKKIPKDISRENIKSHLQKFRKSTDKSVADFMEEFDSLLGHIETEKQKEPHIPDTSSSTQSANAGTSVLNPLEKIVRDSDTEELLGGKAAAYAAYAVKHGYPPRSDRNKIVYEATTEDLPRLSTAEQRSSLGQSLRQVKGAIDFVRGLILKKRHGIPFKLDSRVPPFLKKEEIDEHLLASPQYPPDFSSDKLKSEDGYSVPVPSHISMSAPAAPVYSAPPNYLHPLPPVGGGYPYPFAYPPGDGQGSFQHTTGSDHLYSVGYTSYHGFHHPTVQSLPPPFPGYHTGPHPFDPPQVEPYQDLAHTRRPDQYSSQMHPRVDPYPRHMRSSVRLEMGPPSHNHREAYFEPLHSASSHQQRNTAGSRPDYMPSSKARKHSRDYNRRSVPLYPSTSSVEGTVRRDMFDEDPIARPRRPQSPLSGETQKVKRPWSPILAVSSTPDEPGVAFEQRKRSKPDLSVDTSVASIPDRPLSFELAELGLHTDSSPNEHWKDSSIVDGNESSPFSVTSVLRKSGSRFSPPTTPDRVTLDFGRSIPTPSDVRRRRHRGQPSPTSSSLSPQRRFHR